jgi:MFS family permease
MAVLLVLALSTFAVTVMQTMVIPILSDLARALDISTTDASWLLTASQLSAAVFTPLLGSLGDALGRKRVLLATLALVTVGCVLVAVSDVLALVLIGRVLQGMGFAAMPLAIGIVRSIFPADRVPSSIAMLSAITGIGAGAGLLISGLLNKAGLSANGMFWISGAVTLLGLIGAATLIRIVEQAKRISIDYGGLVTLSGGLVALLLGINRGPHWGWGSGGVLGLFAGALVLLVAWVVIEQRVRQPLVDISMMRRPVVLGANLTALLTGAGMFGAFILVLQFVQTPSRFGYGFDSDALGAGVTLLPMTAGTLIAAGAVSVLIRRFGPKLPLVFGTIVAALTFGFMLLWHAEHWQFFVSTALLGLGLGLAFGAMPTLLNTGIEPEKTSIANSVNQTLRSVGGSIGTGIASAILAADLIQGTPLPALGAYDTAFAVAGGICVLAIVAALIIPYNHRAFLARPVAAPAAANPARLLVPAIALTAIANRIDRANGDSPALLAAAARLAPDGGSTDGERARTAARTVLRPLAARVLTAALAGARPAAPTAPAPQPLPRPAQPVTTP